MIVKGFLVNNTGRHAFIFTKSVRPGQKVSLKSLYEQYKYKCNCDLDEQFIKWLREEKLPKKVNGWDFEDIETRFDKPVTVVGKVLEVNDEEAKEKIFSGLTAVEIADLKVKDKPKEVLENIDSVTKLRRAMTLAKRKKGKSFLVKVIKSRIDYLVKDEDK